MNFIEAAIFILFIATLSVPLASRCKLPLEIFLLLGSIVISGVSLLPGMPIFHLDPDIVFDIFLPPILFSAAYFTSWRDFKQNLRPISQMALGLVIFTTIIIAVTAKIIIPAFTWAEAFLLGAIVSPTDASSATTIIKKLGMSRRFIVLLEGESLVNDATALILYRFSISAVVYGAFSFSQAIVHFLVITTGGMMTGFLTAYAAIFILKKIKEVQAETVFTFLIAFSSFLIAQEFGFSPVISTVTAGIYFGIRFPEFAKSHTKINTRASWGMILFIINSFVFTLIGFELPAVMKSMGNYSLKEILLDGSIISIAIILGRLLWVFLSAYLGKLFIPVKNDTQPSKGFLFMLGWSGMRGIVSLAAALAIPHQFLHWHLFVFLTYFIVAATLVIPALTLPFFMRFLKFNQHSSIHHQIREEANARVKALEAVNKKVMHMAKEENIPQAILQEFLDQTEHKRKVIHTQMQEKNPHSLLLKEHAAFKKLTLAAIEAEKKTLLDLRKTGKIHDDIYRLLSEELDIEEMRAKSLRI